MKTLISALLILLLAGPLMAGQTTISLTGTGGASSGYYYVPTGPPYTDTSYNATTGYVYTFQLPAVGTVTATSIGIHLNAASATACWLRIVTAVADDFVGVTGSVVQFGITGGDTQYDPTISASLSSGTTYYAQINCDNTIQPFEINSASTCTNYATSGTTYSYPPGNLGHPSDTWDGAHCFSIRVGY